jgi:ATP-dependent Clp protease, protease subunit
MKNFNPYFSEKTKDGEKVYDISSRLVKDRVIFLDCELDEEIGNNIVSLLFLLDRESDDPISFWINSPGGSLSELFAIYDMMHRIKAPIKTVCIGEAYSAAAVILAAGTKGMRYAMPHSRIMIHEVQVVGLQGSSSEIEAGTKETNILQGHLTEMLARHTGNKKSKVKRDIKLDRYMSAEEAVKYGIVDSLLPYKKEIPELIK